MAKYTEIRDALKTGDIVLFSGRSFISKLIRRFTRSEFSHVGMVLRLEEFNALICWESTRLSSERDIRTGKKRNGVQMTLLSDRIANYNGRVAIRSLNEFKFTRNAMDALKNFRHAVKDTKYERDEIELIKSAWDGFGGDNENDLSSIFCSELIAESYIRMGLISPDVMPSNEYTPGDFSEQHDNVELIGGAYLGEQVYIEPD